MRIAVAESSADIARCFPVMSQLRPKIAEGDFVALVERLARLTSLRIAYLDDDGIKAVAGYRISEWLAGGRYLEIEDLVTAEGARSKGYGGRLFDWLAAVAAENQCRQVRLVSSVKRVDAHRFYLRKGMALEAHYFSMNVGTAR
ncbi:MAG: GNAT family N-acetyltransferase [Steroidobacteraceae bacterium]|nr:GNAT family N-acetyltransferase [Steroidobacteraceae bacterium]